MEETIAIRNLIMDILREVFNKLNICKISDLIYEPPINWRVICITNNLEYIWTGEIGVTLRVLIGFGNVIFYIDMLYFPKNDFPYYKTLYLEFISEPFTDVSKWSHVICPGFPHSSESNHLSFLVGPWAPILGVSLIKAPPGHGASE